MLQTSTPQANPKQNIAFIKSITGKILAIEHHLRERVRELRADAYAAACGELEAPMIGDLAQLIIKERINKQIFRRDRFNFARYSRFNRDNFKTASGETGQLLPHIRVRVALNLYRSVRNRAFHCADMSALHLRADGSVAPRIFTQERFGDLVLNFGVMPGRIVRLLDDIAAAIGVADWEEY